jgi:hypothetical protein
MNQMISLLRRGATPMLQRPRGTALSSEQKKVATQIAAGFDSKKTSPEMRQEMRKAFDAANIRPGDDLKIILEDAGFKPRPHPRDEAANRALTENEHAKPRKLGRSADLPSFVNAYLDKEEAGTASEADTRSFLASARQMAPPPKGIFVNIRA